MNIAVDWDFNIKTKNQESYECYREIKVQQKHFLMIFLYYDFSLGFHDGLENPPVGSPGSVHLSAGCVPVNILTDSTLNLLNCMGESFQD